MQVRRVFLQSSDVELVLTPGPILAWVVPGVTGVDVVHTEEALALGRLGGALTTPFAHLVYTSMAQFHTHYVKTLYSHERGEISSRHPDSMQHAIPDMK